MADIKCSYMHKRQNGWSDEYYCTKVEHTVSYDQYINKCCSYSYDECDNYKYDKPSSGCFITTVVCDTLGMDDNNMYLMLLRNFRKDYLQRKTDGIKVLEEYDTIGPVIAHCINNDEKKKEVAQGVFVNSIIPVINDICDGKNSSAINKYILMTKNLISKYGLETLTLSIPGVSVYNYNQDKSMMGHGRLIKKI